MRTTGSPPVPHRLALCGVAAIVIGSAVAVGLVPAAHAAFPGRNGLIAYTEDLCDGGSQLATMRPDGRLRGLLTPRCAGSGSDPAAWRPAWAPNGRRLIFEYHGPVSPSDTMLTLADADGSNRTAVPLAAPPSSPDQGTDFERSAPAFAPDGRHFVYERTGTLQPGIWIATIDGSEDRRVGTGTAPRWSPDGRTIAYAVPARNPGITPRSERGTWVMSARTGKRLRRLWRESAESLDWAPDGRHLVASRFGSDVRVLRADGRGGHTLISGRRPARARPQDGQAVWSPDGRRIAFVRERSLRDDSGEFNRQVEIWTISTRGTRARRIWKRHDGFDSDRNTPTLSWQPLRR